MSKVGLQKAIQDYIEQPLPLWENNITQLLVEHKSVELAKQSQIIPNPYTIAGCIIKNKSVSEVSLSLSGTNHHIKIVLPSDDLKEFYKQHGIEPVSITTIESTNAIAKIVTALDILKQIEPIHDFILKIVKSVQLIKAEYTDTDISYSHPDIPFSVFFSVCDEVSGISDLRVAESILHEAMHLKLTLIEEIVPLIVPNAKGLYFSPWRDEPRPARGVLHGLFVFRALFDFLTAIYNTKIFPNEVKDYIQLRIKEVTEDISQLQKFAGCPDLTKNGAILTINLLPLN